MVDSVEELREAARDPRAFMEALATESSAVAKKWVVTKLNKELELITSEETLAVGEAEKVDKETPSNPHHRKKVIPE
jgi:hypothetical protein